MGKKSFILIGMILLLMSCKGGGKENDKSVILSFDTSKALDFKTSLLYPEKIIHLDFSDSILIDKNAYLLYDDKAFFIYSQGSPNPLMRFDEKGHFLNYIGKIGSAPDEYNLVGDACLNKQEKKVEVLSGNYVYRYDYAGVYVDKLEHRQIAFSFAIDEKGNHWFYLGNNSVNGNAKMVKMDAQCHKSRKLLEEKSKLLPMVESNFCKGLGMLTFRESLSHDVYEIADGEIKKSYSLDFPEYHLPKKLHEVPPMDAVALLRRSNYARVMFYAENQSYVFLQVLLNDINEEDSEMYYWIYQKFLNKNVVIKLDKTIPVDSYIYYPQFITEDNKLYFMGFVLNEERNTDISEENPSIVVVDIKGIL
ncbi:6-bladed beta-propeller [Bacteroides heparinolyticus]|uniref:6-bladed beta-propeller n=1 Tax=Prevotella heparinolytica TaxID=28113 RepID=UPI0035A0BFA4